jgi:hypothetical protein
MARRQAPLAADKPPKPAPMNPTRGRRSPDINDIFAAPEALAIKRRQQPACEMPLVNRIDSRPLSPACAADWRKEHGDSAALSF